MSVTRHHADWLSLIEVSGPFISLPVLMRAFPQGLEPRDPAQAKALRAAYEEWQDNPTAPGKQRAWVLYVLTEVLGYPADRIVEGQALPAGLTAHLPEMGETMRPSFALIDGDGSATAGHAQLLIAAYPSEQSLDKPAIGKHWKATPATRMVELLHGADVPLGLVTNGEHWMLVYAPRGETTGFSSWYGALWLDEPITLRAFHSLLGARRFFGVAADSTLLGLLKESANDQQEVTDQLGYQVREAVEVLVQSFDALDKDSQRTLLKGIAETELYNAALTVMMRLVFLFSAEERGLLHLGKPLYDDNYAVSTLQEQLQEVADRFGEEVLERRYDAWARLLATFRAVHGGIRHQDLLMQAYGGSLFDPDRYPFLEGRPQGSQWRTTLAEPLAVNNRVALHLLNSLQRLRTKVGGSGTAETRRVSFRALGVEQIGHVYEGLLDHTAVRANEPVLGIRGTRSKEPEIPLATLEAKLAQGQDALIAFLKDETGRSVSALRRELDAGGLLDEHRLRVACGHDDALFARLGPFIGLIREDSFERPLVVLPGSVYVTAGTARRSTGTHYTPPSLTEPVVRHTLEPLVYVGPAEGLPKEQWKLKSPKEILDLKVCDMAMGSGAFLVQACRYLAERLVEAWENEEKAHPGEVLITPDGKFSEGSPSERLVPAEAAERVAIARRVVADRCLYGVDINPMAVEMAKLSMWLITVDANRPFTFLDHAFKCGDSLLGLSKFQQLEDFSLRTEGSQQFAFSTLNLWRHIEEAKQKRELLEAMPSDTPEQIAAKVELCDEAEEAVAKLKAAADVLVAVELKTLAGNKYQEAREIAADQMMAYWAKGPVELHRFAVGKLHGYKTFHWPLAFPEIMERGGFDALVGNPPFLGGKRLTTELGESYTFGIKAIVSPRKGAADLCAYFFIRAAQVSSQPACIGFVATNSISQGATREIGLAALVDNGCSIYRAYRDAQWPGVAGVTISPCHLFKGRWIGASVLNDVLTIGISTYLEAEESNIEPFRLEQNEGIASIGTYLNGAGFIIDEKLYASMIAANSRNYDVLQRYLTSKDINQTADASPSRYAINFSSRSEHEAANFLEPFRHLVETVKPQRDSLTRQIHEHCFWKHWDRREGFYEKVYQLNRVLVMGRVSKHHIVNFAETSWLISDGVVIFLWDDYGTFGLLQSTIHNEWVQRHKTTMRLDTNYSVSRCFLTFPLPISTSMILAVGRRYYEARRDLLMVEGTGLTEFYNRFHNPDQSSSDIGMLRQLHVEMDDIVVGAYGWTDLDLGHDFHETKQGIRFTISEAARREVLDRLLVLNHQRHAEEVAAGVHDKKTIKAVGAKRGRKKKDNSGQTAMDL